MSVFSAVDVTVFCTTSESVHITKSDINESD